MDPEETLETVRFGTEDATERAWAAVDLLAWLAMGGYCPAFDGTADPAPVVAVCKSAIAKAL